MFILKPLPDLQLVKSEILDGIADPLISTPSISNGASMRDDYPETKVVPQSEYLAYRSGLKTCRRRRYG